MDQPPPLLDDPKRLLLDLAAERDLSALLRLITSRIGASPRVALARIWLVRPGDICKSCPLRAECPDQSQCLHLVASDGRSASDPSRDLKRLDGRFRRFPIGVRKVGRIAMTGEPIEVTDLNAYKGPNPPSWIADPEWVRREGVRGFIGQPLSHHGMALGVLGVFSRTPIGPGCLDWLRMIADHAAVAIAHSAAWDEVHRLRARLEQENEYLQEEVALDAGTGDMVGKSPAMKKLTEQIGLVAPTNSTVLVLGESGVGKELVAREVHRCSQRAGRPLIKVNCAAVPRELFESEFFGHAKGAFTGALRDRTGRFELADGGTLFLDEVGEVPLDLQSKLLRVLQEGEIERIGEEQTRRIDVRIIAATNRDLRAEARAGRFREDLFYRLSVFPIEAPPLRERPGDIPLLVEHFVRTSARRLGVPVPRLTKAVVQELERYDWPGNVRELQHVIERAVILSRGGPMRLSLHRNEATPAEAPESATDGGLMTEAQLRDLETRNLRRAIELSRGKIYGAGGAAELLGVKPTTLRSRLQALGLTR